MPSSMLEASEGLGLGPDGEVRPGAAFRALETAWMQGLAAVVRGGAHLIIDDVFLSGGEGRRRWESVLTDLSVLWVGVHCDAAIAAQREQGRPDRIAGMAERQADMVHAGVTYDLEVDTSDMTSEDCARLIAHHIKAEEPRP